MTSDTALTRMFLMVFSLNGTVGNRLFAHPDM